MRLLYGQQSLPKGIPVTDLTLTQKMSFVDVPQP